ncbi:hypothetical protein ACT5YR_07655 [Fructobacillus fructosus]
MENNYITIIKSQSETIKTLTELISDLTDQLSEEVVVTGFSKK